MLVSRHWLSKFFPTPALPGQDPDQSVGVDFPSAEALAEALTFHAFEIDGATKVGEDDILDVKVTPNRGHDCLSHRGIAKEISAILKIQFTHDPFSRAVGNSNFSAVSIQGDATKSEFPTAPSVSVTLEDSMLSPRYIAGYIKGVTVGPSPDWLKRNLEAMGQRSINNIVDATNFVMFNLGQPLHAFDAGKLKQKEGKFLIVVRKARSGEKLLALDGKEYTLSDSMLVIADGNEDASIGIAGVKGGTPAGITEATTDIIIESANFNGVSVRKTAQALKLRTDASNRFEQGLSPELCAYGMQSVIELIQKLAGGEIVGFADVYPAPQGESRVKVSVEKVNQVLGTRLTGAEVSDVFQRLQFAYKEENGVFDVSVPFERLDIAIPEDLVEEVGRIIGYDQVPATPLLPMAAQQEVNTNFYTSEHVREELSSMGYSEIFTSVFADRGERAVLNKVDSIKPYLRANLTDGLAEALKKNIPNKDLLGLKEIKLFEIGSVWKDGKEELLTAIVTEKEKAMEEPLAMHSPKESQTQYKDLSLSSASRYQPFSKYPYIVRDIAMWTQSTNDEQQVQQMIQAEAGELCVKVSLFDQFKKGDKTSLAFRLIFQSFNRTLTEIEVNAVMEKISSSLKSKGFEIR